jgi:hypothetical protein
MDWATWIAWGSVTLMVAGMIYLVWMMAGDK